MSIVSIYCCHAPKTHVALCGLVCTRCDFSLFPFFSPSPGVLKQVVDKCQPDASVIEICEFGDAQLNEETGKVFKKEKDVKKGIAFPTCLSINNCVGHFSPLKSDKDVLLKSGDLVKM